MSNAKLSSAWGGWVISVGLGVADAATKVPVGAKVDSIVGVAVSDGCMVGVKLDTSEACKPASIDGDGVKVKGTSFARHADRLTTKIIIKMIVVVCL